MIIASMSDKFDYDALVGPPPDKDAPKWFVLYRYTSSGRKTYKAKMGFGRSRTTLKNYALVCNAAGVLDLATTGEWYIEPYDFN